MTTVEFQTQRGHVSHVLLKNEIILRLLDKEFQNPVNQRGDLEVRASSCAHFLAAHAGSAQTRNNLRYASTQWVKEKGAETILNLITAVTKWDKYNTTDAFDHESKAIQSELAFVAAFFDGLDEWTKLGLEERFEPAKKFWLTVLKINDFVRALDERAPDFHRFLF